MLIFRRMFFPASTIIPRQNIFHWSFWSSERNLETFASARYMRGVDLYLMHSYRGALYADTFRGLNRCNIWRNAEKLLRGKFLDACVIYRPRDR